MLYLIIFSNFSGGRCRFIASRSEYTAGAIENSGPIRRAVEAVFFGVKISDLQQAAGLARHKPKVKVAIRWVKTN